jgi:hypothetical protein
MVLRVGAARDTLVVIGAATADDLAVLRDRYEPWLDESMLPELRDTAPAFSVQLQSTVTERRGVRSLPHLRYGNEVLARGTCEDALTGLDDVLGGIHERTADDARPWVQLRLFTDGTRAVLTDTPRPHLVADRELTAAGVREIVSWGVLQDRDHVVVPTALGAGDDMERRFTFAGVVALRAEAMSDAETLAALAAHSVHREWFEAAASAVEQGAVRTAADRPAARSAVRSLLSANG